eukprot:3867772-Rhodomonas_salina.1
MEVEREEEEHGSTEGSTEGLREEEGEEGSTAGSSEVKREGRRGGGGVEGGSRCFYGWGSIGSDVTHSPFSSSCGIQEGAIRHRLLSFESGALSASLS